MNQGIITEAPVDLTVGAAEQWIIYGLFLVAAIAGTIYLLRGQEGRERTFRMLVLAGAALCIWFEPALGHVGGFWYAEEGQKIGLPAMWGNSVSIHMLLGYYVVLGVMAVWTIDYVRGGGNAAGLRRLYFVGVGLTIVLELPVLLFTDIYTYYGATQPFFDADWWPLPLWYPVINGALPIAMGAVVLVIASGGRRAMWLLPVLMPGAIAAIYWLQAWPVLIALNSDVGSVVTWLAATAAMGIAVLVMLLLSTALPRMAQSRQTVATVEDEPPASRAAARATVSA